ncbi:uncharacterized protein LOC101857151 [Aplysia californica]|uniref:Uncharacterized protein LOC101857151 n=1 Tax=Aplysia californica TaxID=6500 RepID=A0ABM1ABQ6_APLCA|nr:uncharacterized protein LOC101857151 [Aplysia californica]
MSQPNKDRKRKMDALISGDNPKAGCCSNAKTACMEGSASGDSQAHLGHEYVTVLRDLENEGSAPVIHSHSCDLEDVWAHKYPLPLGKFPPKAIKTGNKFYDAIIPDLPKIGYKPLQREGRANEQRPPSTNCGNGTSAQTPKEMQRFPKNGRRCQQKEPTSVLLREEAHHLLRNQALGTGNQPRIAFPTCTA